MFLSATALWAGSLSGCAFPAGAATADAVTAQPATSPAGGPVFDFETLVLKMKEKAGKAYKPAVQTLPELLSELDYDQHRAIRYSPGRALWNDSKGNYRLQAFHPGWLYSNTVELFEIADGAVRPLVFSGADFEYGAPLEANKFRDLDLPGIAGFRLHHPLNLPEVFDELIVFLGASYFRALGKGNAYGLSARGLALDTAVAGPEEFPRFTRFYLERPEKGAGDIHLYAELDSERVAGAYRFSIKPGLNTVVEVDARIFLRGKVERLGIAPLTSMFLYGENDRVGFDDYRPEVHDNDGLMILRGDGQRLWRPLRNPDTLALSFFREESPAGFGLLQRDRNFDHYQDTEATYQRRPSLWIEPVNDWGSGQVMLAEIPTDKEIHDNIVAFWVPDAKASAGSEHRFAYRMIWGSDPDPGTELARVVATGTGHGGASASDPDPNLRKFVVEFGGDATSGLGADAPVEARLGVLNGSVSNTYVQRLESGTWRAIIDVEREAAHHSVELVLALQLDGTDITETWLYQWSGNA